MESNSLEDIPVLSNSSYFIPAPAESVTYSLNYSDPQVISVKLLPGTRWLIALSTKGNEFFYQRDTGICSWQMPDQLADVIGDLLATAFAQGPESDEEYDEDDDDPTKAVVLVDEPPKMDIDAPVKSMPNVTKEVDPSIEAQLSKEERAIKFTELLTEHNIDPFAQWKTIVPLLVCDERYLLVKAKKERERLFEAYCTDASIERAKNVKPPIEAYKRLLEKETTHRSIWTDFSRYQKYINILQHPRIGNSETILHSWLWSGR